MLQGPGDDNKKLPFILLEPHRKKKKKGGRAEKNTQKSIILTMSKNLAKI